MENGRAMQLLYYFATAGLIVHVKLPSKWSVSGTIFRLTPL